MNASPPRRRDPYAPVPERDFRQAHDLLHGVTHEDPQHLRLLMLDLLDDAFPFHPALPERILLRLGALAEMWRDPMMEAWRATSDAATLGDTALRIAATHPLCDDGWFNPENFFAEVLRRMGSDGSA